MTDDIQQPESQPNPALQQITRGIHAALSDCGFVRASDESQEVPAYQELSAYIALEAEKILLCKAMDDTEPADKLDIFCKGALSIVREYYPNDFATVQENLQISKQRRMIA